MTKVFFTPIVSKTVNENIRRLREENAIYSAEHDRNLRIQRIIWAFQSSFKGFYTQVS